MSREERHAIRVVHDHTEYQCLVENGRVSQELIQRSDVQAPGTEHLYWSQPHETEAVALLAPRFLVYGWKELPGSREATEVLGRAAYRIALEPVFPFHDPRMMGDALCPNYFNETDELELIIDQERGVVLDWRYLLQGERYERHFFTEIAFDVPLDQSAFAIPVR